MINAFNIFLNILNIQKLIKLNYLECVHHRFSITTFLNFQLKNSCHRKPMSHDIKKNSKNLRLKRIYI